MTEGPKQIIGQGARHQAQGNFAGRGTAAQRQLRDKPAHVKQKSKPPIALFVMGALGSTFVAYAFNAGNAKTTIDAFFGGLGDSAHHNDKLVASAFIAALPFIAGLIFLVLGYMALQMIGIRAPKKKKRAIVLDERMSVHDFAELARTHGAGARVAREAYRMLHRDYADTLRSTITRSFTADLNLPATTVEQMFLDLVERTGGVIRSSYPAAEIDTPVTMMQAAERCVERAALERRAAMRTAAAAIEDKGRTIVPLPAQSRR